jgi:predicted adenylyl cyclase CyaB
MSHQYEIEIKSLLGDADKASSLRNKISEKGGELVIKGRQLNHYFTVSDVSKFKEKLTPRISQPKKNLFEKIINDGNDLSIRTRDTDGEVKLVIKASIGNDTSSNGVSRMEFEDNMGMSLDELDKLLLNAGLKYQAKWSREREEYRLNDINICLDRNAGYGYLAEFEKIVPSSDLAESVKKDLLKIMKQFDATELHQDRLERMFAYYNNNWQDYYGTEKIFNIE